jgi:hypothetical protein
MNTVIKTCLWVLIVCVGRENILLAQPAEGEDRTVESLLKQKGFVDNYVNMQVQNWKEQYSLTPEQVKKVRGFITKDDVRFLFKSAGQLEAYDLKMRRMVGEKKELTVQDLQDVQDGAGKLYPLCQKTFQRMMVRTMKLHSILTDEQKKTHQKEIDELELNTAELTNRLDKWKEGNIKIEELQTCFSPKEEEEPDKTESENDPELKLYSVGSLDFWELYVKTFIDAFELDKGQRTMAYSVLGDMKLKAKSFREDHAREYAEAKKRINELREHKVSENVGGKNVLTLLAERKKQLQDIDKPLLEMFEELKLRLMKIPTEQQQKKAFNRPESADGPKKAK